MSDRYYDATKILSLKDIRGERPEIYAITSNRTAGKTTWFSRWIVKKYLERRINKFALIYRFNYELNDVAEKFFKDIKELFFKEHEMTAKIMAGQTYANLYLDEEHCGYALCLNGSDKIKTMSHLFSDVDVMFFDEFQSESDHYCPREITKLQSVHKSIARGRGQQTRYVPVIMCSNPVTLLNPYYAEWGVSDKLQDNTKFFRGDGFIIEHNINESAAKSVELSGFERAFKNSSYSKYNAESVYLNDNYAFIEKMSGKGRYMCTIKYDGGYYGVIAYFDQNIVYVTNKGDQNFPSTYAVSVTDHAANTMLAKSGDYIISILRDWFKMGCVRFKNLQAKSAFIKLVSY